MAGTFQRSLKAVGIWLETAEHEWALSRQGNADYRQGRALADLSKASACLAEGTRRAVRAGLLHPAHEWVCVKGLAFDAEMKALKIHNETVRHELADILG